MTSGCVGVNTGNQTPAYQSKCSEMKQENEKLYNENHYLKNRVIELLEKLQKYQEEEEEIEVKYIRLAI